MFTRSRLGVVVDEEDVGSVVVVVVVVEDDPSLRVDSAVAVEEEEEAAPSSSVCRFLGIFLFGKARDNFLFGWLFLKKKTLIKLFF